MFYKCILSVLNTVWLSESKGHKNFYNNSNNRPSEKLVKNFLENSLKSFRFTVIMF